MFVEIETPKYNIVRCEMFYMPPLTGLKMMGNIRWLEQKADWHGFLQTYHPYRAKA